MATLGQYNAAEMTAQEVFDAGASHLLEQGRKSLRAEKKSNCLYSGPDGRICGAAPFVQNYSSDMEGQSWEELVKEFGQTEEHLHLIGALQDCHDSYKPKDWQARLKRLAHLYKLEDSVLEKYEDA